MEAREGGGYRVFAFAFRSHSVRIPFAFVRFKSVLMLRLWVFGMNCQGGALLVGPISVARAAYRMLVGGLLAGQARFLDYSIPAIP